MWLWEKRKIDPETVPHRYPAQERDLLASYQWMLSEGLDGWCDCDLTCAASHGFLSVVQWLVNKHPEGITTDVMIYAVMGDHLDVVVWLYTHGIDYCSACALYGGISSIDTNDKALDAIRLLTPRAVSAEHCIGPCREDEECRFEDPYVDALANGRTAYAQYLLDQDPMLSIAELFGRVIAGAHRGVLQWLYATARSTCIANGTK